MSDNISAFNATEYDEQIKKTLPYYEDFYNQIADIINIQFREPVKWPDADFGTGNLLGFRYAGRLIGYKIIMWKIKPIFLGLPVSKKP